MRQRLPPSSVDHRPMSCILLLLVVLILSGCGETGERMREGAAAGMMGMTVAQARTQQAQAELMQIELQKRQRQQRAEENLPRFRVEVVPSLNPIATDLIKQKREIDSDYQPGPEIIEEAAHLYNQAHPQTPITPTDLDTFYLTEQGRMAFWSLKILPY